MVSGRKFPLRLLVVLSWNAFLGAASSWAFAPAEQHWLIFLCPALAFVGWLSLSPRQAGLGAWSYGVGLQCAGVGWIYYSLHVHGSSPAPFAFLVIFLLACYLSVYTGLAAFVVNRFCGSGVVRRLLFFYPAAWVVFEWMQGYVMTGFAWMQWGYTQIDLPLSGYAPLLGNHAVGGLVAFSAGVLALGLSMALPGLRRLSSVSRAQLPSTRQGLAVAAGLVAVWLAGGLLRPVQWTEAAGEPLKVSLVQGNIPQAIKWRRSMRQPTLERYRKLTLALDEDVDLVIWPETAIPDYWYGVRHYIRQLEQEMTRRDTVLLTGIFIKNDEGKLLNSILNVNGEVYSKRHLVPLGEFIPLRSLIDFFRRWVDIPMSDIASGADEQPLMVVKGVPLGLSICFEEAFVRDVLVGLPEARLLVNVSNDAWFEDSRESYQHHAIARMRALETGRFMVRATNTGISSIIDDKGNVVDVAPHFQTAVLTGQVQPMKGATPFVRWGDGLILLICGLILVFPIVRRYT